MTLQSGSELALETLSFKSTFLLIKLSFQWSGDSALVTVPLYLSSTVFQLISPEIHTHRCLSHCLLENNKYLTHFSPTRAVK